MTIISHSLILVIVRAFFQIYISTITRTYCTLLYTVEPVYSKLQHSKLPCAFLSNQLVHFIAQIDPNCQQLCKKYKKKGKKD